MVDDDIHTGLLNTPPSYYLILTEINPTSSVVESMTTTAGSGYAAFLEVAALSSGLTVSSIVGSRFALRCVRSGSQLNLSGLAASLLSVFYCIYGESLRSLLSYLFPYRYIPRTSFLVPGTSGIWYL